MILGYLLVMVAAALIFAALIPPIPVEDARAGEFEEDSFPKASENAPITYLVGKDEIKSPNTLFAGAFRSEAQRKRVKTGLFSSKRVTTHFKNYLTIDLGLCLGGDVPVTLHGIKIDGELVWEGEANADENLIEIDSPTLFGGNKAGGGFTGIARYYPGTFTQGKNAWIDGLDESQGLLTNYKGIAHIVFEDCYIGESPQLRQMSFIVSRFTNTLGLADGKEIIETTTVNVAEAIYSVMVDDWAGLSVDPSLVDIDNFRDIADLYHTEGYGAAGGVYREKEGSGFIQEMVRITDTIMSVDPVTSLIDLRPLRNDYTLGSLLTFGPDQITSIESYSQTLWQDLIGQVKIAFKDEDRDYISSTAVDQDLAVANITEGRMNTSRIEMPFVKKASLAQFIAGRELNQLSKPAASATMIINRNAYPLGPGGVFIWNWPEYGIEQMVMRVKKARGGDDESPEIRLEVIRDPYGEAFTTLAPPTGFAERTLIDPPVEIEQFLTIDSPPFLVNQADVEIVDGVALSYPMLLPINSDPANLTVSALVDSEVESYEDADLPSTGTLATDIDILDGFETGQVSNILVATTIPDNFVTPASDDQLRGGLNLFVLGNEIMAYTSYIDNMDGTYELNGVKRGLLNSSIQSHTSGDRFIWLDDLSYVSEVAFEADESPTTVQFLTSNGVARLDDESVANLPLTFNQGYERPDPPDFMQIGGERIPTVEIEDNSLVTFTWRARDSFKGLIQFIGDAADTGTNVDALVYDLSIVRVDTGAGVFAQNNIAAETVDVTLPAGLFNQTLEARVYSKIQATGLESLTYDLIRFTIAPGDVLLLEGDEQDGTDKLLLEGDEQDGTDVLAFDGDEA